MSRGIGTTPANAQLGSGPFLRLPQRVGTILRTIRIFLPLSKIEQPSGARANIFCAVPPSTREPQYVALRAARSIARCGITPHSGVAPSDLLVRHSEREYETDPFRLLLTVLGEVSNNAANTPLSEHVWHLQVGSITGLGDYMRIAERMSLLAQQALPITEFLTSSIGPQASRGCASACELNSSTGQRAFASTGLIRPYSADLWHCWRSRTLRAVSPISISAGRMPYWAAPRPKSSPNCAAERA